MFNLKQGLLATALIVAAIPSIACTPDAKEGFVPKNNLKIGVNSVRTGGITEEQFNNVIDLAMGHYAPVVASLGAKLSVERNWNDGTVNAYAQQNGKDWRVSMFGGLARHETITEDGFTLVICHEIGHHIGGAPRKVSAWASSWASNEGQSDYFANLKCLRQLWRFDNNIAIVKKMAVPAALNEACGRQFIWNHEVAMCIRGAMAGMSVAKLFQALRSSSVEPKFDTPDTKVVAKTDDNHPAYQCRLDTYLQGSLCTESMNVDVSADSEVTGTCHKSLGDKIGLRPLCWFKPAVN